jgi:hypothetical protein
MRESYAVLSDYDRMNATTPQALCVEYELSVKQIIEIIHRLEEFPVADQKALPSLISRRHFCG